MSLLKIALIPILLLGISALAQDQSSTFPPILAPDAEVNIPELGKIKGLKWLTYSLSPKPFYVFHSIPYAQSVKNEARFKVIEIFLHSKLIHAKVPSNLMYI